MEKLKFTFSEIINELANDPDLSDDPAQRAALAYGIKGSTGGLTM